MNTQWLEQRARELLAAEYERERCPNSAAAVRNNDAVEVDTDFAIRVIVAALRQQPVAVDLEQFREIAEGLRLADQFFDGDDSHWQWDDGEFFPASKVRAAHKRLLALIDNAGKVECAEVSGYIATVPYKCDRIIWRGQYHHLPLRQPAPVVDDARMARALEWVRGEREPGGEMVFPSQSVLAAIEEAIAAYDPNCGARTVRVAERLDEYLEKEHGVRIGRQAAIAALTAALAQGEPK